MIETGITRNSVISELSKSPHGKLDEYVPTGKQAAVEHSEFFAHLIAWNQDNGQIRDSKVALPIVSLAVEEFNDPEFVDNSLAHIAMLSPRDLLRGFRFARQIGARHRLLQRLVKRYLTTLESNWAKWERKAVQHRRPMKELYALTHTKPSAMADAILFKGQAPKGTVFESIANLKNMQPREAAGTILERKIPFLIAVGALGKKAQDTDLALALIESMSSSELINNTKMLERMGMKNNQALRAAYEQGIAKAAKSKKNTLKASVAAEAVEDEGLSEKLKALQEKQIKAISGIEGNWLVLGDRSGSMRAAIETAKQVAGALTKLVKGKVYLVFFDTVPQSFDATGKTYDEIQQLTRRVQPGGCTSIGCGVQWALDAKVEVDGIAVISDGGENQYPRFADAYKRYSAWNGKEPTVYYYRTRGDADSLIACGVDMQVFDIGRTTDYYSVVNLASTMRVNRYDLVQTIMDWPLVKLDDVLKPNRAEVTA